jgi:hypothetical protein
MFLTPLPASALLLTTDDASDTSESNEFLFSTMSLESLAFFRSTLLA